MHEYSEERVVNIHIVTWNFAGNVPSPNLDLTKKLFNYSQKNVITPDLIVFGNIILHII
jgi:hypothetical protein